MSGPLLPLAPVRLAPNQVWRSYAGGSVLRAFRGQPNTPDDHFPEDWLASTVRARNGSNSQGSDEGLSRVGNETLNESFKRDPRFWFGEIHARSDTGVLWKLLDSSVRLQFQAHPDASFARKHLNSNAGKTECWYILETRGSDACVYLGFQRPPTREAWSRMIEEQDVAEMMACFDPIPVKAGECYVVPAGTPHAIGAGVFMMELMEPTDWVVRCESANAGVRLPPEACFMGIGLDRCLDIFDYNPYSVGEVQRVFQQTPVQPRQTDCFSDESVIGRGWKNFFKLRRLRGTGGADWMGGELNLLVVRAGSGLLQAGNHCCEVKAGETWLLPGAVEDWRWESVTGPWEILLAQPPDAQHRTTNT